LGFSCCSRAHVWSEEIKAANYTRARKEDPASHTMAILRHSEPAVLILLVVLILVFGFGGYRMGPGLGYYGGGGLSLILTIVVVLLLLKVI
jgi:hypothetical protein